MSDSNLSICTTANQRSDITYYHSNPPVNSTIIFHPQSLPMTHMIHTDTDIGYGPAATTSTHEGEDHVDFHPSAPPVSGKDGSKKQHGKDVVKFDSNFIMAKKSDVRHTREVYIAVAKVYICVVWVMSSGCGLKVM